MNDFWKNIYWGNKLQDWVLVIVLITGCILAITIMKRIALKKLGAWAIKIENTFDDFLITVIEKTLIPALYVAGIYFSIKTLTLPVSVNKVLQIAYLFATTFFSLKVITAFIKKLVFSFIERQENSEAKEKQAKGLLIIVNITIWTLGLVFVIDNLGYDVTTLVAGLGIGGIAIALAAQTILGDLFSYFVIFFDRPFEIGDFIIVDDKMGAVEYIGIKTTRIRTLGGEQLICSNTDLTNARVHNYKRMEQRRVVFKLGVVYQTTVQQLKKISSIVKEIIESKDNVRYDRGNFSGYGDFSLNFEFVYYIESSDYNFFMDKQQEIYFDIFEAFESEQIAFAYPTQSVFIHN